MTIEISMAVCKSRGTPCARPCFESARKLEQPSIEIYASETSAVSQVSSNKANLRSQQQSLSKSLEANKRAVAVGFQKTNLYIDVTDNDWEKEDGTEHQNEQLQPSSVVKSRMRSQDQP
ncbi:hypothetical protein T265_15749, partial [Opisthorchis viverrini]